jgi:hypothetical protein
MGSRLARIMRASFVVQQFIGNQIVMSARRLPSLAVLVALGLSLFIWTEAADAGLKGAFGFASGGTYSSIAFDSVISFDRTMLPTAAQSTYQSGSLGGLFSRPGLIGGFAAGFLGSGVIGVLFGHGVVGELNGTASILGLVFQLALIVMLGRLIWLWWHDDKAATAGDLSPRQLADAYGHPRHEVLPDIGPGAPDEDRDDGLGHPK